MKNSLEIEEVLRFWFGGIPSNHFSFLDLLSTLKRYPYWYGKAFPFLDSDQSIEERYEELVQRARKGELVEWESTSEGRLALILLLDQLPRNIYRGKQKAFESDKQALDLAQRSIILGDHLKVHALARTFYFFPLMHQEDIALQDECVEHCKDNIVDSSCFNFCSVVGVFLSSLRHRSIVQRFGRYPHRNAILGRRTTKEEKAFLRQPFSSF
ncbi:MAG: hypothetical protein COA99_14540 [Moraxellaceae bacterium]|nr:MAG: hypothetical protein COA99_14540 [Moraxellaceae bacterium]